MDNDKARPAPNKSHFWGPVGSILETSPKGKSKWEMRDGDGYYYDYRTAHARAHDEGFEKNLPETCGACRAVEIAAAALESAKAAT